MQQATNIEIAISQLVPSKRNVRKSKPNKEADQELLAGIRAEGLLQNLVVIQNGTPGVFEVVAGKRRLKALQQLVKEGHLQETDTVPCRFFADAANAEEISLIENTQRLRMHPADEFEACQKMLKGGAGTETIAANLGIPESTVRKRLKLAQVAPQIIKAYRNGEIDLEDVMAFTVEEDRARQVEVFNRLAEEGSLHSRAIRSALRGEAETSKGRLAKFVGESAYTKAGGIVSHDLFQETTYFNDRELLIQLAVAKLDKAAAKLEGWNWIEITIDIPHVYNMKRIQGYDSPDTLELRAQEVDIDEKIRQLENMEEEWTDAQKDQLDRLEDRLAELQEAIDATLTYKPDEMALAGCVVTIGLDGKLEFIEGLVRKSDEKALRELQQPNSKEKSKTSRSTAGAEADDDGPELSQALRHDLVTYRLNIAKRFLAIGGENEARDLLYYTLCMRTFNTHYWDAPLAVHIEETRPQSGLNKADTGRALSELEAFRTEELELGWMRIEDPAERFTAFTELDLSAKIALMAYCVAQSLVCGLAGASTPETEVALHSLDIPWHKYFQPTAENYLGRISKDALLDLGEQFFTDWRAEGAEKRSKKQLAEDLEGVLAGKDTTMPADKRAEAIDWIPEGFRPL